MRNLYEGGVIGEGVVKELRPLVAKGVHWKWATNLLLSHYRHRSIDLLIGMTVDENRRHSSPSTCPLGERVESSKYKQFSTLAEVSYMMSIGQPIPVLLFGCETNWKAGTVVVFKKFWFFRELMFLTEDFLDDDNGITFH